MKKYKNIIIAVVVTLIISSLSTLLVSNKIEENKFRKVDKIYDYVFDAGTYTDLDYDYASKYFLEHYDNYGGGCTAVAKVNSKGEMLVGRNMDLNISNKAAYVFRTDVEGCYKTVNLMYTFRDYSPDYEDVLENGLPEEFNKIMPFLADDVLNEKGLYVEVNMRYGEYWPTGEVKYSCSGTNPEAEEKVYMFTLSRYIGEHCATVEEAIEYVKSLNVFSQDGYWNYCFMIADASGHYGLLEFALNQVIWHDYQPAQANFYIDPTLQEFEELKAGVGRYNKVMEGIDAVESEEDMFKLIDSASYFQFYDPENCQFDYRSENVGALAFASYDVCMDENYKDFLDAAMSQMSMEVKSKTRQQLRDANEYWESAFTEVINCNNRTLFVRFYEDDNLTLKLTVE